MGPDKFEDRYETALIELINQKRNGLPAAAKAASKSSGNVINLMGALTRSLVSAPPRKCQRKSQSKSRRRLQSRHARRRRAPRRPDNWASGCVNIRGFRSPA